MSWESEGIRLLTPSLLRPFVLAAAAWLILRILRVRHPASRHSVWTAVLIGMLLLPLVSDLFPHWKLPVLPTKPDAPAPVSGPVAFTSSTPFDIAAPPLAAAGVVTAKEPSTFHLPAIQKLLICCYLAGLLAMLTYRTMGWVLLWRIVARARPLHSRRLRESADILTPVAVGVLWPAVILPAAWRTWSVSTRRAVLAHEFAHLRRHDAAVSALARLVQCLFWYHPLAWWVSRKTAELAELACDAAALERVEDAAGYSRILLEFADTVNRAGQRIALPGLAMASGSRMDHRIDQVFLLSDGPLRKLSRPGMLLALIGLPVMGLAATIGLGESGAPSPVAAPPVQAQPEPSGVEPAAATPAPPRQTVPQSPPAPAPKFEVASIKPCSIEDMARGGRGGAGGSSDPIRVSVECRTVKDLIESAYLRYANGVGHSPEEIHLTPIEGGPSWIESEHYTVDARPESPQSQETMRGPMMQALLEDRFHLKIHRENREVPVYELTVTKGGPKLQRSQEGSCIPTDWSKASPTPRAPDETRQPCRTLAMPQDGIVTLDAQHKRLADFCKLLVFFGRPVIDKTGLTGFYDFHLVYSQGVAAAALDTAAGPPENTAADVGAAPPFPVALQELGLKLEQAKGPREFLVIDHVERPSGN